MAAARSLHLDPPQVKLERRLADSPGCHARCGTAWIDASEREAAVLLRSRAAAGWRRSRLISRHATLSAAGAGAERLQVAMRAPASLGSGLPEELRSEAAAWR